MLTWPENLETLVGIRAALLAHVMPSKLLLRPGHRLTKEEVWNIDQKLILGYQTLKDETCSKCGTPAWIGRNNDSHIEHQVRKTKCNVCATSEKSEAQEAERVKNKSRRQNESMTKEYGVTKYVVAVPLLSTDTLPTRADYYRQLAIELDESEER